MKMSSQQKKTANVLRIMLVVIIIFFLVRFFLIDAALIQGRSMLPGYAEGDIVFILKCAYGLRGAAGEYRIIWTEPQKGDIVAAIRPDTGALIIKRVSDFEFLIDTEKARMLKGYFLLGDNKFESSDSREFGAVPMNNILGKLIFPLRFR